MLTCCAQDENNFSSAFSFVCLPKTPAFSSAKLTHLFDILKVVRLLFLDDLRAEFRKTECIKRFKLPGKVGLTYV